LLRRPAIDYKMIKELQNKFIAESKMENFLPSVYPQLEVLIKYGGYIKRQNMQAENAEKLEKIRIPANINYKEIKHISTETKELLEKIRPTTLAQASRIGGVKPADISVLMVMLQR